MHHSVPPLTAQRSVSECSVSGVRKGADQTLVHQGPDERSLWIYLLEVQYVNISHKNVVDNNFSDH